MRLKAWARGTNRSRAGVVEVADTRIGSSVIVQETFFYETPEIKDTTVYRGIPHSVSNDENTANLKRTLALALHHKHLSQADRPTSHRRAGLKR